VCDQIRGHYQGQFYYICFSKELIDISLAESLLLTAAGRDEEGYIESILKNFKISKGSLLLAFNEACSKQKNWPIREILVDQRIKKVSIGLIVSHMDNIKLDTKIELETLKMF
jgi:hypothetical protein